MAQENIGTAVFMQNKGVESMQVAGLSNRLTHESVTISTNFRMASISKQFTAACVIILKNRGLLNYEEPLSSYFPDFKTGNTIKIRHLLTHTSGLVDYENLIPKTQKTKVTDNDVLNWVSAVDSTYFLPGTKFRYSNTGFCILAELVAKVSRTHYEDFVNKNIFIPLQMKGTFVYSIKHPQKNRALGYAYLTDQIINADQSIASATKGDGCIYTSLNDYTKWIDSLREKTLFNLKEELNSVNYPISSHLNYGLGWFNVAANELYHTGSTSGFSNVVCLTLDSKNALVFFSNLAENHHAASKFESNFKPTLPFNEILNLTN